ncbi:acyl-CoA N-acyltransferase [Talaromyces proteolyticus]|uniref:Acyl-CoA N-acyltransferase n=1 Tax=Talaromyces proteolyticus TaxID=1131652 RepID=A0AAD4KMT6_9EURO|nr:acyl-CoA N-acyltransferase [Talaromyces proteolyticus]KAH8695505.1 acyl-CoA N-acyltransferase [Talaromyces proteolyticus]
MAAPTIEIRQATAYDIIPISQIHYRALERYHEFYAAFLATHPRDILPKSTESALKTPDNIFLVAADSVTGKVVGFTRYYIVPEEKEKEEDRRKALSSATPSAEATQAQSKPQVQVSSLYASKSHVKDIWDRFSERDDEMEAVYTGEVKGQRHLYVKHLMIDPAHQRKGIGQRLLSAVLAKSDAEGIPTFLTASAESHALYEKLGFVDIGPAFRIDNEAWAREVLMRESVLGMEVNTKLEEQCRELSEVENCMVRWVRT